jgi:hypothetical protein
MATAGTGELADPGASRAFASMERGTLHKPTHISDPLPTVAQTSNTTEAFGLRSCSAGEVGNVGSIERAGDQESPTFEAENSVGRAPFELMLTSAAEEGIGRAAPQDTRIRTFLRSRSVVDEGTVEEFDFRAAVMSSFEA